MTGKSEPSRKRTTTMSQISGRAASARENARQADGKFGSYQLQEAGTGADLGGPNASARPMREHEYWAMMEVINSTPAPPPRPRGLAGLWRRRRRS